MQRIGWMILPASLALGALAFGGVMNESCATSTATGGASREAALEASPQYRDGKFHNTLERHDGSYWTAIGKLLAGGDNRTPEAPLPVLGRRGDEFREPPESGLRLTWLGHSTTLVEIDGKRVLLDPVWSERASPVSFAGPKRFFAPPLPLAELPPLDAVVISHDHFDHLDRATIEALKDRVPRFVVPLGVGAYLEDWGVAPERIVERDWWGEVEVSGLRLVATPARHFSGRSWLPGNQDRTLWAGWAILGPVHRVYFTGDTAMFPGFAEIGERLGPFDATLIESGAYNALWPDVHLGPEQALLAHRLVRGRLMLPVHWGTFNLAFHTWVEPVERLLAASSEAGVALAIPRPGESVEPARPPALVRWWPEVPWQKVEEAPVVSTGLEPALLRELAVREPLRAEPEPAPVR